MELPVTSRKPYLVLRPPSGWAALDLRELWQFRDLLLTLAARDVKLRYRQTLLGIAWVVLQPLIAAGAFTLVFGVLANLPSTFIISYAGMLGWTIFSNTLTKGSTSLVTNAHLVSKVYFPRLALPLSVAFSTLIDFAVGLVMMVVLMGIYRHPPTLGLFLLPIWIVLLLALGTGIGLLTSALTVTYRDVQYIVPVLVMILQYVSPVGYLVAGTVPHRLLAHYMLNPLAGLIEAFRWSMLGSEEVHWAYVGYAGAISLLVLLIGALAFKRMERKFADVI